MTVDTKTGYTQYIELDRDKKSVNALSALFHRLAANDIDCSFGGLHDSYEGLEINLPDGGKLCIVLK